MPEIEYMWDELSDNVAAEYEDGLLAVGYTHEPRLYGNLLSQNRNGITSYYHYDGRGDTVALTDDAANITDTKEYDAWGNVIASTGSTVTPYQFAGERGSVTEPNVDNLMLRTVNGLAPYSPATSRLNARSPRGVFRGANTYLSQENDFISDGKSCFEGGTDLLRGGCEAARQRLGGPERVCYSPADLGNCFAKLDALAAHLYASGKAPCASDLLMNWLSLVRGVPGSKTPFCPPSCIAAITGSAWYNTQTQILLNRSLRDYAACNESGRLYGLHKYGGPCQDPFSDAWTPFKGVPIAGGLFFPNDLGSALGAVDHARFRVDGTFQCGQQRYAGPFGTCCCLCSLDGVIKTQIRDKYDFKSTLGKNSPWYVRCAAIIEDATGITGQTNCDFSRPLHGVGCRCDAPRFGQNPPAGVSPCR